MSWLRNLLYRRSKKASQKSQGDEEAEEETPVLLKTHVKRILHSVFSNVVVYINDQQIYNFFRLMRTSFTFSTVSKDIITEYKEVLHRQAYDYEEFPIEHM